MDTNPCSFVIAVVFLFSYFTPMEFDLFDTAFNQVVQAKTYDDFAGRLRAYDCRRCPRCSARSNIVVDRGNPAASLMIISERPGENEDRRGLAFVGRSGELLDRIMAAIKLDTSRDLLIANVVKCIAEEDRAPTSDEAAACRPFLERQMELVNPKVILLLGAVAYKFVAGASGEFSMEKDAGKFLDLAAYPGIKFMVLYHPAFLLRDPTKKKDMWAHVQELRRYLDTLGSSSQRATA